MKAEVSRSHRGLPITRMLDQSSPGISTMTARSISRLQTETGIAYRFIWVMVWEVSVRLAFLVLVILHPLISATGHSHLQRPILIVTTKWIWSRRILPVRA